MSKTSRLGQVLTESGACNAEAVEMALRNQRVRGGRLGTNLLALGLVEEERLAVALEKLSGMACYRGPWNVDPSCAQILSGALAEKYDVVPITSSKRQIAVLACEPGDLRMIDELRFATGRDVRTLLALQSRIWSLMRSLYGIERDLRGLTVDGDDSPRSRASEPLGLHPNRRARSESIHFIDDLEFRDRYGVQLAQQITPSASRQSSQYGIALQALEKGSPPEILRALLAFAGARYGRAVILLVRPGRPGMAVGWEGVGVGLVAERVRQMVLALRSPGVIEQVISFRAPVFGPLAPTESNRRLLISLGGDAPANALVVPVLVQGQPLALLYADGGPRGSIGPDTEQVLTLVEEAGRALSCRLATFMAKGRAGDARSS